MSDGRALRYQHRPYQLPDGRWMVTRRAAVELSGRHVDHIRKVCEAQRHRWIGGDRGQDEEPIEVLCTIRPRMVLLDLDALTAEIARRPFADWKRRQRRPLEVE